MTDLLEFFAVKPKIVSKPNALPLPSTFRASNSRMFRSAIPAVPESS